MADLSQLNVNNNDYNLKDAAARNGIQSTQVVSGNPLTLTDCAPINAESLVVEFEPKQDLHGQSAPWVGGAGKNKVNATGTHENVSNDNGIYTLTSAPSSNTYFVIQRITLNPGNYILNGGFSQVFRVYLTINDVSYVSDSQSDVPFTITETTTTNFYCVMTTQAVVGSVIKPMIRLASETDPTFAPYENICPITGYTGVEVGDVGFNQWDEEWEVGGIIYATGLNNDYVSDRIRSKNFIPCFPSREYYAKSTNGYTIYCYDVDKNFISRLAEPRQSPFDRAFSTPQNAAFLKIGFEAAYGTSYKNDTCINLSKTTGTPKNGDYAPYQFTSASIQFGQTVYGGKSDFVEGGTDNEWTLVDFGDLTWTNYKTGGYSTEDLKSYIKKPTSTAVVADCISECYKTMPANATLQNGEMSVDTSGTVYVVNTDYPSSASDFKTAMTGLKICYKKATADTLATPETPLPMLKGTNNLTTNGTTISLGYQPDNVIGELKGMIQDLWDYVLTH